MSAMASRLARIRDTLFAASIVGVLMLVDAIQAQPAFAQGSANAPQQYEWSAELVSFDPASGKATLKARIDARADRSILAQLSEGDQITITWTGLSWGAGISAVTRGNATTSDGRLHLPAEFVRSEMDDIYLVFRVPVPQGSRAKVEALKPGDWVTARTSRDASRLEQAVSEIRGYNDVS